MTTGRYAVHGASSTPAPRTPARTATDDPLGASWRVCWAHVDEPQYKTRVGALEGSEGRETGTGRATAADGERDARYRTVWNDTCGRGDDERADDPFLAPIGRSRAAASPVGAVWRQPATGPVLRATRAVGPSERSSGGP